MQDVDWAIDQGSPHQDFQKRFNGLFKKKGLTGIEMV
jgi:hypothetical protein